MSYSPTRLIPGRMRTVKGPTDHVVVVGAGLAVAADAIVAVEAGLEPERMRLARHGLERREAVGVDDRVPVLVVVRVALLAVVAALLPVVVEADVAIAEVAERRRHAVDGVARVALDHRLHDGFDEVLVHVSAVEVPRPPSERRRLGEAIVFRERR